MQQAQAYFKDKTVVVTGAAGFIGSHLCDQLLGMGATVIGVDNLLTGRMDNLAHIDDESFTFIEADVIEPADSYLPEGKSIDAILHFASPASPPRYQANPVATYLVNSVGTHNLLQYLREFSPEARFLFASTSEVYGDPLEHPQTESYWGNVNPNGPRSCYDESKRLGETICGIHARDFGMDTRIARIFNTYGPRMDPKDGRVIPNLITQALTERPYTIYGDGSQTRSFCYVDDQVAGILRLATALDLAGETVNIGTTKEFSVTETAKIIHSLIVDDGSQPEFSFQDLPQDDPTKRQPDISKAKELLNWQPKVSFRAGLEPTAEYFKSL